jgi:hypothetical protein
VIRGVRHVQVISLVGFHVGRNGVLAAVLMAVEGH